MTVAEGVELEGEASALGDLRCVIGQGFLWSRPLRPEALEAEHFALLRAA